MNRYLARLSLILAALLAGVLNGSPLAAPVLIFMVYLVTVLVRQGRAAVTLIEEERLRIANARAYTTWDAAETMKIWETR
jgi:hypothetical protein